MYIEDLRLNQAFFFRLVRLNQFFSEIFSYPRLKIIFPSKFNVVITLENMNLITLSHVNCFFFYRKILLYEAWAPGKC